MFAVTNLKAGIGSISTLLEKKVLHPRVPNGPEGYTKHNSSLARLVTLATKTSPIAFSLPEWGNCVAVEFGGYFKVNTRRLRVTPIHVDDQAKASLEDDRSDEGLPA